MLETGSEAWPEGPAERIERSNQRAPAAASLSMISLSDRIYHLKLK